MSRVIRRYLDLETFQPFIVVDDGKIVHPDDPSFAAINSGKTDVEPEPVFLPLDDGKPQRDDVAIPTVNVDFDGLDKDD